MPYEQEHACRLREPGEFEKDSFRRIKQGRLSIIIGRLKGKTTTTAQAYRYPKDSWTAAQASAHCKEHKGRFEAAASKTQEMEDKYRNPATNPFIRTGEED